MELMFDGEAQAVAAAAATVKANREAFDAQRRLLQWPADADAVAGLAARYRHPALGELQVRHEDGRTVFDVGGFSSAVATLPQPDGSLAFVTIDPVAAGFPFVRADEDGERRLVVRDGQHEYVFAEVR